MHSGNRFLNPLILTVVILAWLLPESGAAQQSDLDLRIRVGSVEALEGDTIVHIPVYLQNVRDTVSGFLFLFQFDRPDVASLFEEIETENTLIEGWDVSWVKFVDSAGLSGLQVLGQCDRFDISYCGFAPQMSSTPLFYLKAQILPAPGVPDDNAARLSILQDAGIFTVLAPDNRWIGMSLVEVEDTSFYRCAAWMPPDNAICLDWERVSSPPYDSMGISTHYERVINHEKIAFIDGTVQRVPIVCGDIDGSYDGSVSLGDLTRMIDFLFISLQPFNYPFLGNTDGSPDGAISLGDLSALVDHLFISLAPLDCGSER